MWVKQNRRQRRHPLPPPCLLTYSVLEMLVQDSYQFYQFISLTVDSRSSTLISHIYILITIRPQFRYSYSIMPFFKRWTLFNHDSCVSKECPLQRCHYFETHFLLVLVRTLNRIIDRLSRAELLDWREKKRVKKWSRRTQLISELSSIKCTIKYYGALNRVVIIWWIKRRDFVVIS